MRVTTLDGADTEAIPVGYGFIVHGEWYAYPHLMESWIRADERRTRTRRVEQRRTRTSATRRHHCRRWRDRMTEGEVCQLAARGWAL